MKHNRSIVRCLEILRKFSVNPNPTATELSELTDIHRTTVIRFLRTLEEEGYVRQERGRWRLTANVLEIGFAALQSSGVTEIVHETLNELADKFEGTANIGESVRGSVLIIARAVAHPNVRRFHVQNLRVGDSLPEESALCQALTLKDDQEYSSKIYPDVNQVSLAVPLKNGQGRRLSLGIATSLDIINGAEVERETVEYLKSEALRISRIMNIEQAF